MVYRFIDELQAISMSGFTSTMRRGPIKALVLRQDADANVPRRNADDAGDEPSTSIARLL